MKSISARLVGPWALLSAVILLSFVPVLSARPVQTAAESGLLASRPAAAKPSVTRINPAAAISHVVVKFTDASQVRLKGDRLVSRKGYPTASAEAAVQTYLGSGLRRLFADFPEEKLDKDKLALEHRIQRELADLNGYYRIDVSGVAEAENIINELNALDIVEIAYFEPVPEVADDIDPTTPDWTASQDYREAAPAGVDADYANTLSGGDGSGVKIIDIENNWRTTHEDLDKAAAGIIGGIPPSGTDDNHGTAVLGEMVSGDNGYGVTGICPGADAGMISVIYRSTAEAIYLAADTLKPGDVVLIELHSPGPHYNFEGREDQLGYVCMEYWQANYDAMLYAFAKGVIIVEAAGNGAENFDDAGLYGSLFDTTYRNSHAIIVGAGYPWASIYNLQKHGYSNYGRRVNLQGYGSGVYTTGYGDLFAPNSDPNQYYTASFSGTSSASPIVTGAVTCLQGRYKHLYNNIPMNADQIRTALVATGTPQAGDSSRHIGPRPNLAAAFGVLPEPSNLCANPLMVEAEVLEGSQANRSFWIVNRSTTEAFGFSIVDSDSLAKRVDANWLVATPKTGVIPAHDSAHISVLMDGTVIPGRVSIYKGVMRVSWGAPGTLDSLLLVPAFFSVLCNDQTYSAASSHDAGGPTYQWISAKTLGTRIANGSFYANGTGLDPLDDGTSGPWPINFSFPFYDDSYTNMYVGVNGAISFTDAHVNVGGYFSQLDLPGAPFATLAAPFWNDLLIDPVHASPDAGVYLYTTPGMDTTVIEWYDISNFNNTNDHSTNFEIIMTQGGEILFQYHNVGVSSLEQAALVGVSAVACQTLSYYDGGDIPEHMVSNLEAVSISSADRVWVQAGDANHSGAISVSDVTYLLNWLFGIPPGPQPPIMPLANANCAGVVNVSDVTYLIAYMFGIPTGPAPCWFWLSL
jgi:serine protease